VGAAFVAIGSGILLFNASDLSIAVVVLAVLVAGALVYAAMALNYEHITG
jgi:hypothetical protein